MSFRIMITILVLVLISHQLRAQKNYQITGILTDKESSPLVAATVVLLHQSDSSFASYGLSSDKGQFKLEAKRDNTYILQISYMGYNTITRSIQLDKDYDFETLIMEESSNLMESVQVEAEHIPIRMRGDTLEFNSSAFNVQAHDDVEKLLEQMPGVEIDKDGNVKINGKKVEKILVDGKEFFGEDVKMALKNLPADAIEKIDVYDKDKEAETEEKEDEELKTLNLTLKEDKKVGFMGNIEGGYGYPDHRYKGRLSLNYFNPVMRISVIGGTNNINESGFSYKDYEDMTGGYSNFMRGNSAMSLGNNWDDPVISLIWGGDGGETRSISGGINANFFLSKNTDLSFHYLYTNANRFTLDKSFNRSITPETYYTLNGNNSNILNAQRHVINTKFSHKIDSTHEFKFRAKVKLTISEDEKENIQETYGSNDSLENKLTQISDNKLNGRGVISNLYYKRSFKKKDRVFSVNIAFAYVDNYTIFNNLSNTEIYNNNGVLSHIDSLNQIQQLGNSKQVYGAQFFYKEPLGEKNSLQFKLTGGVSIENNDRMAEDIFSLTEVLNDSMTDTYYKHYNFQHFKALFEHKGKKATIKTGIGIQRSQLTGMLISSATNLSRTYYYPLANINFNYKFTKTKSIYLNYRTNINEPTLNQLQPMVNNQNPLSLFLGNMDLNPSYRHNIWMGYNHWDQATFTSLYTNGYLNITQDDIRRTSRIDENFSVIYQPENLGTSYSGGIYMGYSSEIKKIIKYNIRGGVNLSQLPVKINETASEQFTHGYSLYFRVGNKKKKIVDFSVSANGYLGNTINELNNSLNVTYINHTYKSDLRVCIAKKWNIGTDFSINVYDNLGFEDAIAIPVWSAYINRTFFKGDKLKIEFIVKNILNEDFQVSRYSWYGIIGESQTNMLGRFFMLSLAYKINKMGGKS